MARRYAEDTKVPVSRTRAEIEELLRSHGVEETATLLLKNRGIVGFQHARRVFRLEVDLPMLADFEFRRDGLQRQVKRSESEQRHAWDQACRAKWRSILLIVKARLVAIEAGAESWESAFMAHVVLPNGELLGPGLVEKLAHTYAPGGAPLPPLLPPGPPQ